jgi:hypothetical protein
MLYRTTEPVPATVTGANLAYKRRTASERAFLASDLLSGRVTLAKPTRRQIASLARVSLPLIRAAERISIQQPHLRPSHEGGFVPLIPKRTSVERMVCGWASLTTEQRLAFVRTIGADQIFDAAVAAA